MKTGEIIEQIRAGELKQSPPAIGIKIIYIYSGEELTIEKLSKNYIECSRITFDGSRKTTRYTAKKNGKFCIFENAYLTDKLK